MIFVIRWCRNCSAAASSAANMKAKPCAKISACRGRKTVSSKPAGPRNSPLAGSVSSGEKLLYTRPAHAALLVHERQVFGVEPCSKRALVGLTGTHAVVPGGDAGPLLDHPAQIFEMIEPRHVRRVADVGERVDLAGKPRSLMVRERPVHIVDHFVETLDRGG